MHTFGSITHLDVDVADEVVAQVVTHVHLLHLPVLLLHLCEHLLRERENNNNRQPVGQVLLFFVQTYVTGIKTFFYTEVRGFIICCFSG